MERAAIERHNNVMKWSLDRNEILNLLYFRFIFGYKRHKRAIKREKQVLVLYNTSVYFHDSIINHQTVD